MTKSTNVKLLVKQKKLNSEDMIKDTLKIDYPGLPRITDIFISGENHCTVCEYVEGESVFDYINEKEYWIFMNL